MKLKEIAGTAIELLRNAGQEGLQNTELASALKVPRRRVYDILAILKATSLVKVKRQSQQTWIYWQEKEQDTERKLSKLIEVNQQLKNELQSNLEKNAILTERISLLETEPVIGTTRSIIDRMEMQHPIVRVIAEPPGNIKRFHLDGLGVVIETTSASVIIEPVIRKVQAPWESKQVAFTRLSKS